MGGDKGKGKGKGEGKARDGDVVYRRPSKKDRDRLKALGLWPPPKGGKGKASGSKGKGPDPGSRTREPSPPNRGGDDQGATPEVAPRPLPGREASTSGESSSTLPTLLALQLRRPTKGPRPVRELRCRPCPHGLSSPGQRKAVQIRGAAVRPRARLTADTSPADPPRQGRRTQGVPFKQHRNGRPSGGDRGYDPPCPGSGKVRREGRAENPHRSHGWPTHRGGLGAAGRVSARRKPEKCLRGRATCQGSCVAGGGHGRAHQASHGWLAQVGDALFLEEFPRCAGLSLLGIGGSRATFLAPGDSALVWKLTSAEDEPNRMAGHGLELLLRTYLPGIFASRTRLVGDGLLDIRSWGTIRVEILEMERLQPMPPEPSPSQIIHMAFVILAFSSAGIMIRDFNKHNWGVRRFSNDGD